MGQKERLLELIEDCNRIEGYGMDLVEKKADYLLENGVIVPPVKVGDTVYCVEHDFVDRGVVYAVLQDEEALWISAMYDSGLRYDYPSHLTGCRFFLTREEAEQALKESGMRLEGGSSMTQADILQAAEQYVCGSAGRHDSATEIFF